MATVEIIELIKPETGEKFYPYAHLNGVKGAELLPRIGGSVQTTLPTPIFQIKDALNAQFYPQTHADAVIGLAQAIESNQFFAKESDGNGGFRIKLKDEFTGFYANGWAAAGGFGTGGGGGGGVITSVRGVSELGTPIAVESLAETFSAKAIESIWEAVLDLREDLPTVTLANGATYSTLNVNGAVADFYTKAQVDGLISGIRNFEPVPVQTLPTASADTMYKLYLVPSSDPQSQNIKDEYITYRTGSAGNYTYSWEQVGSTAIDLTGYVTLGTAQTITGLKTFSGGIVMAGANIGTSADSANSIGSSSARFNAGYIRNLFTAYLGFTSDDGQTQRGVIGMGDGNATIHLLAPNGTEYGQYSFFGAYGFFHSGNGDVPCGRSDHRWEKVWSVDGDLSGDLSVGGDIDLASTSHIDIGPARIEYDATNGAIHVTTNQSGNDAPTIGLWADGFNAAGGVGEGGGSGVGTGWINANDFGFLPTKTASANATALNECLRGGGKTVIVSKPGTYQLDATILLYDDTTIVFGDGVVVKKAGGQQNVFRNAGATARTYNRNIRIVNLVLSVSGSGMTNDVDSDIFGLRGEVAFLCTENVSVSGFRCEDLANGAYAIQFNQSYNFLFENFVIRGQKDGIHISSVDTFVIRHGVIRTDDDALALNACDWVSSNCVDGDITNGIIEDVTDEATNYSPSGYGCRLLVGAWADWSSGMSVRRGDTVVCDGRIYRAYTDSPTSTVFTSAVRPTITTFSGKQQDTGGFYWKLMRSDKVYYSSNIVNVEFRDIRFLSQRRGFVEEVDTDDPYNRSLHPSVAYADYPKVDILVNGYVYEDASRSPFVFSGNTHTHLRIDGMSGVGATFYVPSPADASMLMRLDASHIDFRKVTAQTFITNGYHTEIRLMDCVAGAPIPVASYGRIITNNNLADLPGDPAKGDQVIHNGTPKVYNGSSWTSLI